MAETGSHTGVQAYYNSFLGGGGWSEGWGYGPVANVNMACSSLAAKTAKAIDLVQDPATPFSYPWTRDCTHPLHVAFAPVHERP